MGMMELRRQIALNEPHLVTTAPAGIANFSTDMIAPLKSCKVEFLPVQSGSGDPSPDNVRPISGWTGCEVRNAEECHMFIPLSGTSWTQNGITIDYLGNGKYHVYGTSGNNQSSYIVPCEEFTIPSGEGRLLELHNNINAGEIYIFFQYNYGAVDSWRLTPINRIHSTFITMAGKKANQFYFNFTFSQPTAVDFNIRPLFIKNATTTIPLNWTTEAGTVYGGYVDFASGELVATKKLITLTGANSEAWSNYSAAYYGFRLNLSDANINGKPSEQLLSDKFIGKAGRGALSGYEANILCTYNSASDNTYVFFTTSITDKTEWLEWLEDNPTQLCYPIATPITYQLTPTQLKSLRGVNNIWSDANGDTTVKFWTH